MAAKNLQRTRIGNTETTSGGSLAIMQTVTKAIIIKVIYYGDAYESRVNENDQETKSSVPFIFLERVLTTYRIN